MIGSAIFIDDVAYFQASTTRLYLIDTVAVYLPLRKSQTETTIPRKNIKKPTFANKSNIEFLDSKLISTIDPAIKNPQSVINVPLLTPLFFMPVPNKIKSNYLQKK